METKQKKNLIFTICLGILSFVFLFCVYIFKHKFSTTPWDGTNFDILNVNALDRLLAHPFNKNIHGLGNILCITNLSLLPLLFLIYAVIKSDNKVKTLFTIGCLYIITFFFTKGFYDLLKMIVHRIRPYMYFPNPCEEALTNGDFQHSWPSGHTTNAFMGIGFVSAWFILLKDNSPAKKIFIICGYVIALATGICRILSGNHFLTDVLSGAVLGSAAGYGIIFINNKFGVTIKPNIAAE